MGPVSGFDPAGVVSPRQHKKACYPGWRPGIHVLTTLSDVRWDLERAPGRVDSRLRGNDNP